MRLSNWTTTKSSFTAWKIFCVPSIHPSFLPTPDNHWSFYCVQSFAFSRMPWCWYPLVLNSVSLIFFPHFGGNWAEGPGAKGTVDVITSRSWGPLVTSQVLTPGDSGWNKENEMGRDNLRSQTPVTGAAVSCFPWFSRFASIPNLSSEGQPSFLTYVQHL